MHALARSSAVAGAALLAFGAMAAPALAAAPSNDLSSGATAVALGYSATLDTSEATTDAEDAQLNEECGAPSTDASVWYTMSVASELGVVVDVSQSDYPAGVLVGTGTPGSLTIEACGPGGTAFLAVPGTTYWILVIDDQSDEAGNGGTLEISIVEAPPPPTLDVTVNRTGTVNSKTGVATVSGTFTCTDADFADIQIDASQAVGRFTIRGFGEYFDVDVCDGTSHPWSAPVFPDNGRFSGGKAVALTFSFACGPIECFDGFGEHIVQLKGGKK